MIWLFLAVVSAVLLGAYDIAKKHALTDNAVPTVLALATTAGTTAWLAWLMISGELATALSAGDRFFHLAIAGKAALVTVSWLAAFAALKHLPISIVSPIRATAPVWTLIGAVFLFGERPGGWQWLGIAIILASYIAFSLVGRREGIAVLRNQWIGLMVVATLTGALSSLYDKYLLQTLAYDPVAVQTWFAIDMMPMQWALVWCSRGRGTVGCQWRWSIPAIGVLLILADRAYFIALHDPEALLSLVSAVRRSSVVVAFALGAWLFKEVNIRAKAVCLIGVIIGVGLVLFAPT